MRSGFGAPSDDASVHYQTKSGATEADDRIRQRVGGSVGEEGPDFQIQNINNADDR